MEEEANAPTASRPGNKNELLDYIQKEWSALMQSIATLTDEQITTSRGDGWSVKDNLAHLAAWEQFLLQHHLGGWPAHRVLGVDAATFETLDEDGMNAVIYEQHTVWLTLFLGCDNDRIHGYDYFSTVRDK